MWIMLMQTTASKESSGQSAGSVTSSTIGSSRLGAPDASRHARMLASAAGSASVGCQ
jgi:hypothetical protein